MKLLYVGVTGTQSPGPRAYTIVQHWLAALDPKRVVIVQGCCIGMDEIVGKLAHQRGFYVMGIVPANRYKVAQDFLDWCDIVEEMPAGTSFMQRNDRIVELVQILYAFPKTEVEELRSGTWATVRRARKKRIHVGVIPVGEA